MILRAFFLALGQFGDRRFRRVMWLGIGLTIALLVASYAGFLWLINALIGDETIVPVLGEVRWLDDLVGWSSLLFMLVLSVFLMVPVASAITSMFLEDVAKAVEDKHYPNLPEAQGTPFGEAVVDTLSFLGLLIVANLGAFLLYVLFPPLSMFIFWGLNGFLLGREYFTLAAMRRVGRNGAKQLRKQHIVTIWLAGVLMAIPLSVPILNLFIPILGAATFTHLFHMLNEPSAPTR